MGEDWLGQRRKNWLRGGKTQTAPRRVTVSTDAVCTVTEAARILGVDRTTILRKFLALDPDDSAPIPFNGWYRLPGSGHIRVYLWAVEAAKS